MDAKDQKIALLERIVAQQDYFLLNKEFNKIILALPAADVKNPIAALINYCNHFLGIAATFRYEGNTAEVLFSGIPILKETDESKPKAKERATIATLKKLNEDRVFLLNWIQTKLERSNKPKAQP